MCETSATINLLDPTYTDPNSAEGNWFFDDGSPVPGNILDPSGLPVGNVSIYYQLSNPVTDCDDSQTQVVVIAPQPNSGTDLGAVNYCVGESQMVDLAGLLGNADPFGTWTEISSSTGGAFDPILGTFNTTSQNEGVYTFQYGFSNIQPCMDVSTTVTVILDPLPIADAGTDQVLDCVTTSVSIGGAGTTPGAQYIWTVDNGSTVPNNDQSTTDVTEAGVYTLTVIDGNCQSTSLVTVTLDPSTPSMELAGTDITCFGFDNGIIDINNVTGGSGNYEYSIDDRVTWLTSTSFEDLTPGDYTVWLRDDAGCEIPFSISIQEPEALTLDATAEAEVISLGDDGLVYFDTNVDPNNVQSITVTANGVDLGINTLIDSLTVTPTEDFTDYCITIVDLNGCEISDCVEIRTSEIIINDVYISNVFTPNGDNNNDFFFPQGNDNLVFVNEFYVFDRWGERIFGVEEVLPNTPEFGWDGKFKGEDVVPGVYVYLIEVVFANGELRQISGDVTVIR